MEFHFNCINCAQPILLSTDHLGVQISCPHCLHKFCVPDRIEPETIFQPFTEHDLTDCINHLPKELITQIQQVPRNDLCWPSLIFAIMIDSTLNSHLLQNEYAPSGGSLFAGSTKAKRNIIEKQFEYFEIISRLTNAVNETFHDAVENHDIYLMCRFAELLRIHLMEFDQFFKSLQSLDYPAKEPYAYLVERMFSWKEELCFSIKIVVVALHNRAKLDPEQASLSTVQVSLTPMSIYQFNDVLFN